MTILCIASYEKGHEFLDWFISLSEWLTALTCYGAILPFIVRDIHEVWFRALKRKEESAQRPAEAVNELHGLAARRFRISAMISPLVCSELRRELLITMAPSGTMSGAAAR